MSFSIPRNVPNFQSSQRPTEDVYWRASSSSQSRYTSAFGAFSSDSKNQLPMYKDKPHDSSSSPRRRSWRLWSIVIFLAIFTWTFLMPSSVRDRGKEMVFGHRKPLDWVRNVSRTRIWEHRKHAVIEAMVSSWSGYEKYAWGYDEYHPNSKSGRHMVPPSGLGWIIVDSLDTMMLMNLTTQLKRAREWISTTLTYDLDHDVNTFETTIRMVGGLLSAHYLQTEFPDLCPVDLKAGGEDLYLEKATDLADRLVGAYNSKSGIPYASVNLHKAIGIPSHDIGGASSTAEATTLQLEMKYLSKLTGETMYWDKVEKVMEAIDSHGEPDGLKAIFVNPETATYPSSHIRLGSRGDSYYEYLIKQYYQTSEQEPIYLDMWKEALSGIKKHLITYSYPSNLTIIAERPNGVKYEFDPKMDHLVCFMPGTLAFSTTGGLTVKEMQQKGLWTAEKQEDLNLAIELMKTCYGMYRVTKTGLAPEIAYFNLPPSKDKKHGGYDPSHKLTSPEFEARDQDEWKQDYIIKPADTHNLQRPETVESLFYMWRITGDSKYREWGWKIFEAFMKYTEVIDEGGYTSINNVNEIPTSSRDNMESFWPAETLKYFYLLFGPNDVLPLDKVVFNTEAHPFPKFELGKLFKTGWKRLPRNDQGMILREVESHPIKVQNKDKDIDKEIRDENDEYENKNENENEWEKEKEKLKGEIKR